MDEMKNMNETTMENETSVEVVPEENVEMINTEQSSNSGSNFGLIVGAVGVGAAVLYGLHKKHKAKKEAEGEQKPKKAKKKIHLRTPWTVEEEPIPEVEIVEEDIEETSEEK